MATNNIALLALYKTEKEAVDFPSEPFPKFSEWKKQYLKDRQEIGHKTVDIDEAVVESDNIVQQAEMELKKMTEQKTVKKTKKVVEQKQKVEDNVQQINKQEEVKMNQNQYVKKTHLAREIYKEMMIDGIHPKRKDVIERFMKECDMSNAGASTYHYNIKKEFSQQPTNNQVVVKKSA